MKTTINFTFQLWNPRLGEAGEMEHHTFAMEVDPAKLKPAILHKARKNKAGKALALNGAVVIRPTD